MELTGIARTIDHAVYTLLNALAMILWRIDAAIIGMSMLSYQTQAWLTGPEGGVWSLLAKLVGVDGILGLTTWQLFLTLALVLFGFSRIVRPFWRTQPVDLGRLFFFAIIAYFSITQGSAFMRQAEMWRNEAGSYVYEALATEDGVTIDVPGDGAREDSDPLYPPAELDGVPPIRGWEAVGSSYFLASQAEELHAGKPPAAFLNAYCLYDPDQPIDEQTEENEVGCSPQKVWDEWDLVSTQAITQVLGIPLPDISIDLPVVQEHPANRQLGLRQAQAGVARLALGPVVALFPMIEANVGLMLSLAASFIYLSLPITLLFGFFMYTEAMATRLLMQFISIFIRTLLIQGLVAIFLMLLISASAGGSLTVYLGLVGVGLVGGIFLTRLAAGTMKETLAQSLGTIGGIWMGATTGMLGKGAARPARAALGVAKLGAAGAAMVAAGHAGGMWRAADLGETAYKAGQSGLTDVQGGAASKKRRSALPAPLARMVAAPIPALKMTPPAGGEPMPVQPAVPLPAQLRATSRPDSPPAPTGPVYGPASNGQEVEQWVEQFYQASGQGRGRRQAAATGRALLGEALSQEAQAVLARRSEADSRVVLQATRQARASLPSEKFIRPDGQLDPEGVEAIRASLPPKTAQAFGDRQGQRDLTTLVAAGLQPRQEAHPETFQRAVAEAQAGQGEQAPGRTVPRKLGLDPVAAGSHFASLNRFARLSEQAGLSPEQRQRLLREIKRDGNVSARLRREIETALRQKGRAGLKVDDLVDSARSLPATLSGPVQVRLPDVQQRETQARAQTPARRRKEQPVIQVQKRGRVGKKP